MNNINQFTIKLLQENDLDFITSECAKNNWPKPRSLFELYFYQQYRNERLVWLSFAGDHITGYCTLKWRSEYNTFRALNIPEVKDLNVFPSYRNQGIASKLLSIAENEAFKRGNFVGIGVGLSEDYGNAQRLYVQKGYIPDGNGVTYNNLQVNYGEKITVDDDLNLWLIKKNNI